MKTCNKCKTNKPLLDFYFRKKNGTYRGQCKFCLCEKRHERYKVNKEKILEQNKKWRKGNVEKNKLITKQWKENNKDILLVKNREYRRKKLKNDIYFKITDTLRSRVNSAIKNQYGEKSFKTMELVGCSIKELMNYIQNQFADGMSWTNHGKFGWHIDHIRPCSSYDLTNSNEQEKCFHYSNLQPLWAKENLIKSDKIL